jgi:hypothetical protein
MSCLSVHAVKPTDELRHEVDLLFTQFLPPKLASRFSGLLAMKPERWRHIDLFRVWEEPPLGGSGVSEWVEPLMAMLESPLFKPHLNRDVVVLRCGHNQPSIRRECLRELITGKSNVLEGFVSIIPGALGLAMNHDGEVCVLNR